MQAQQHNEPWNEQDKQAQAVTCFTPGTAITTLRGNLPVESLRQSDRVLTRDRGFQPILWTGARRIGKDELSHSSDLQPILIRKGALGPDLPERDMMVSPRHRLLRTDPKLRRDLNEPEVLVEARALVGRPGISRAFPSELTYIHLLFEQHEIILSENTWTESFHLSQSTVRALQKAQHREITALFPDICAQGEPRGQAPARVCVAQMAGTPC